MEKAKKQMLEFFSALSRLVAAPVGRPERYSLRDIGLESWHPGLAQQMLEERRRHSLGLL